MSKTPSSHDPFDPAALRLSQDYTATVGVKKLLTRVPVRKPSLSDLQALGHEPMSAQKALRLRCLDCCCGSSGEVRVCAFRKCASWPFRLGSSPWKSRKPMSDGQRAALAIGCQKSLDKRKANLARTTGGANGVS